MRRGSSRPAPRRGGKGRKHGRVAVLDIGSNSIRLVVYDRECRTPVPIFNEKVLCGLGRGLAETGRLSAAAMASARENLVRFVAIARAMGVRRMDALATAAVRDAANGREFVSDIERRSQIKVRVISGEEEARLSALGVLSAIPDADGVMGDLGGASLELVDLGHGRTRDQVTLPLGPLRLVDLAGNSRKRAHRLVDAYLGRLRWLNDLDGREFYAVGGAWRSLARVHMAHCEYPLRVIHHYAIERREAETFLRSMPRLAKSGWRDIPGVSRRLESLEWAGLVLERVLALGKPVRVVFSAYGLREGCLFDQLKSAERRIDPLISACLDLARSQSRFPPHAEGFLAWMGPILPENWLVPRRLVHAACLLSDIGWQDHPDYRPEHAFLRVLRLPVVGIDHPGRAFLALAIGARYAGRLGPSAVDGVTGMIDGARMRQALIVGLALRLANTLSGGVSDLLAGASLRAGDGQLTLRLSERMSALVGDVTRRRLDALAQALQLRPRISTMRAEAAD
ncbi:MAG: Ppx/GppA family phosphatase [Proteobacteria bacterium]|nr:Ppx/GppA family phosphatase [Pseudomonadota bacterium]MBI3498363.1 Ppx/GppA family phosphatase [Pseudomonadota bacterium]